MDKIKENFREGSNLLIVVDKSLKHGFLSHKSYVRFSLFIASFYNKVKIDK